MQKRCIMNIRFLKTLVTYAELGTFVATAKALGLTQSAVSAQMQTLEEQMGTQLFDRTKRPPVLNAHGRALLSSARQILFLYDQMAELVSDSEGFVGTFHIGAVPTMLTGMLPSVLHVFKSRHPELQLRVSAGTSDVLVTRLDRGELDVAIISEPVQLPASLSWEHFISEPLIVIGPESAEERSAKSLLQSRPFIRLNRQTWFGRMVDEKLLELGITVTEGMELDTVDAIALMVYHGLGVSVVPERHIEDSLRRPLKRIRFGRPPLSRKIGLSFHKKGPRTRLVEAFYDTLSDAAKLPV